MTARPDDTETPRERKRRIQDTFGSSPSNYKGWVLQRLVDGPILDAYRAFCPAGMLTRAEMKAREAAQALKP